MPPRGGSPREATSSSGGADASGQAGRNGAGGATDAGGTATGGIAGRPTSDDLGRPCSSGSECELGWCSDGVCCESECSDPCRSCVESGTGLPNGRCGVTSQGTDPYDRCTGSDVCDGEGRCRCANGRVDGNEICTDCGGLDCEACGPNTMLWSCGEPRAGGCCYANGQYNPPCSTICRTVANPEGTECTNPGEQTSFPVSTQQDALSCGTAGDSVACVSVTCTCTCR